MAKAVLCETLLTVAHCIIVVYLEHIVQLWEGDPDQIDFSHKRICFDLIFHKLLKNKIIKIKG